MRSSLTLFTALAAISISTLAHAEPPGSPPDRRDHSKVGATVGLFTPTGELGIEYAHAFHPNVEVSVGAGYGLVRVGPQFSLMPRLRTRVGAVTLSLGAGVSGGKYNNISPFSDENAPQITTLWGNAEGGIQVSSQRGPFVRLFVGAGKIVAHGAYDETDPEQRMELDDVLPYAGLTIGSTL